MIMLIWVELKRTNKKNNKENIPQKRDRYMKIKGERENVHRKRDKHK